MTAVGMQSRAIPEMIQERAQFCARLRSDRDGGIGLARPLPLPRLANRQSSRLHGARRPARAAAEPPKITFFSDTCPKSCGRRA
jgi:hypothetical protein